MMHCNSLISYHLCGLSIEIAFFHIDKWHCNVSVVLAQSVSPFFDSEESFGFAIWDQLFSMLCNHSIQWLNNALKC